MECRAHKSWQYKDTDRSSRMQADLLSRPHNASGATNFFEDTMIRRLLPAGKLPHVCIVGAGMAGLRCADVLTKKGVKVTLLEARNRIGGRVYQSTELGRIMDLGPNWIHGTADNPILDLARGTNTLTLNPEGQNMFATVDQLGHFMAAEKSQECTELMWEIIDDAFSYSRKEPNSISQDRSLLEFFQTKTKERNLDFETSETVLQMARIWGDFIGDLIEKQSLKYLWLEGSIDGENLFVASTYKAILDCIAESALRNTDLHLSTKVTQIISKPKPGLDHPLGIAVLTDRHDAPSLYDEVVVTFPLGYLQHNLSAFSPPLPTPLSDAIAQATYGRLEKVFVTFQAAFWSQIPSEDPRRAFFTHFLHPRYAPERNPKGWNINCASLAELPGDAAQPALLFYMHGECAEHITTLINGLSPDSQEYYDRLQRFFETYYSRLPNYSSSSSECVPKGFLATNWQNDEFAGYGSYANFQVSHNDKEILLDENIKTMRKGAPERNIWLAGEHTAPFVALGTTTGAYWSGEAVARRILSAYGMVEGKDVEPVCEGSVDASGVEGKGTIHSASVVGL